MDRITKAEKEENARDLQERGDMPVTMRAQDYIQNIINGKVKLTKRNRFRFEAAKALLPHQLPRLNSVDVVQRNVEMTHEEFVRWAESHDDDGE